MAYKTARSLLIYGIFIGALSGCRAHAPKVVSAPPASTQDACQQIRDFFKKHHATSDAPEAMSAGCHMHIGAGARVSGKLDEYLQTHSWTRNPAYSRGTVPSEVAYETPSTRCTIAKLVDSSSDGGSVSGGIGIGGGSHMSTGFGIGLGMGSSRETRINYKIDCLPK